MNYLGAHLSVAGGVDRAITRADEFGMNAVQIFTKNANQWAAKPLDPVVIERFHVERERCGLEHIVAHDSYLINVASPNDELREKSRLALREELDRCDQLGVPFLVSHPGAHMGEGPDAGIARLVESVNRIHAERPEGRAVLLLETTAGQGSTLGSSFAELAQMIDGIEDKARVGVCMDTCHIFAAGYDIRTPESYAATMDEFETVVGFDRLRALHINDSLRPFASRKDRHAAIGEGEIGPEGFRSLMNDPRMKGIPGLLETPKEQDGPEDIRNLGNLKALLAQ